MEAIFAVTGKDFVLFAADDMAARSIVVMKRGEDKSRVLNAHNVLFYNGEHGDAVNFSEYIQKNINLQELRHGIPLTTAEIAHYTRRNLADALRTRNAYHANFLLGGVDPATGEPSLFWMDHLSSCVKVPFGVQGYSSYFCSSTMDRFYHPDMTLAEAKGLVKKCIGEMQTRFVGNFRNYTIKLVDREGVRVISL